jgi:aldose 1-epimerase
MSSVARLPNARRIVMATTIQNGSDLASLGQLLHLKSGMLRAALCPRIGRLVSLQDLTNPLADDLIVPLSAWPDQDRQWAKAGAYPLIPYSNRIFNGRLRFGEATVTVASHPDASPHSLHGHAHLLPWEDSSAGENAATLRVVSEPGPDWPWRFEAWQRFELRPQGLRLELGLLNLDTTTFPAGLGWHPYIRWQPEYQLRHDAKYWWPHDKDYFPKGQRVELNGSDPLQSEPTAYLDEWSKVEVERPGQPTLELTAGGSLNQLVVHFPLSRPYGCIEPVSHLTDAFNRAALGWEKTGARVVGPGETITGWIELRLA